jgi:hypothetical protein
MEKGLLHLHSLLRWVVLILLLVAIYKSFAAGKTKPFTQSDNKIGLFLMIACDIMLLLGLYQWFTGPLGLKMIQEAGMGVVMKDKVARFWAAEHFAGMLIAIILVHIGRAYAKKNIPDVVKHKRTLVFFGLALLIILISIPWPFREGIGRPWFPGM